ncbi:hypothetical protein ALC62_13742 [Cyphomyrmex costatus]|uniref:Uncharacterized protein n=1 Tax=Cyphomyrmex costatus TaxID=456900 RepID=A0A195C444_9HYME|nr:hypothetical protein ALC62_13742 [Cyphomyrmex costatus]
MAASTASRCAGYPRIISLELRKSIFHSRNCSMENDRKEFARSNRVMTAERRGRRDFPTSGRIITIARLLQNWKSDRCLGNAANHVNLPSRDSMRVFAVHERIRRKVDRDERSEVDGGERGRRAGVLLRGSVVKRIDPNHYDMSRLRFAASTMAGSSPENETSTRMLHSSGTAIKVFHFIRFTILSRSVRLDGDNEH